MSRLGHALITGGAGAIGAAIARVLRARDPGIRLHLVDVDQDGLSRVASSVGGDVGVGTWDLARPESLDDAVAALTVEHGDVDLLVNCAGFMEVRSIATIPWELAERLLRVDLESPLRLMSLLAPPMVAARRGAIVNVASMAGVTPLRGCAHYGAAKAGLAMASECAQLDLAPHGVTVVTVLPGPVRSRLEERARSQYVPSLVSKLMSAGDPDVLARLIVAAVDRGTPRVVYPPLYDVASRFPRIASRLSKVLSPPPRD